METPKRRFGDRRDGRLMRELDAIHFIGPVIYPSRCDNEAFISERFDLTNLNAYLAKCNANEKDFPYTFFHIIVVAFLKTVTLRPKLNRFIANSNTYQRHDVSAAFVVKKLFSDDGEEGLAFLNCKPDDNLQTLRDRLYQQITQHRKDGVEAHDATGGTMEFLVKIPRFLGKFLIHVLMFLDRHGWVPQSISAGDPYYSSVFVSNVGSIKLRSGYHHLADWGTNSVFVLIGEKKMTPAFDADGNATMRETVDLGLTIDERLADGYYYSKSIRLLKKLIENPELLELPMSQEVDYES